jgi:NADPH-dependent ferric siderophore reductase
VNSTPHESSTELARRLGVSATVCDVVSSRPLSPTLHEVVIGHAGALAGEPGNDVMLRLVNEKGNFVRRRYSVRAVDLELDQLTFWITTAHDGPGAAWARNAQAGAELDVVGPRGKITLDPLADWHVFIGDTCAFGSFYRMAQGIEVPGRAIFIVEINSPEDALTAEFDEGLGVTGIFIDRQGRAMNDPAGILSGLAAFEFPPDVGHAYLFGEFNVMKATHAALVDRGLNEEQISRKAFWRTGRNNADLGEPDKSDN